MKTRPSLAVLPLFSALLLGGCATETDGDPPAAPRGQAVWAVTEDQALIRFDAGAPRDVQRRIPIRGLSPGETVVGMDFRVSRGVLYALTSAGRLGTLDLASGQITPVGSAAPVALQGRRFGVDFNPVADRLRVVSDTGQNLRLHPDTGALAATDPDLSDTPGAGVRRIAGAAYTYNKSDDKLTTNYAIDLERGWLVAQGSVEGRTPVVSPNTGRLADVGPLGTGPIDDVQFDIADIDNRALAALRQGSRTRLYTIDLASGRARLLGTVHRGDALRAMAIEP